VIARAGVAPAPACPFPTRPGFRFMPVSLRPIGPLDMPFLLALYSSTREEELSRVAWTPMQKEAFLRQQFEAQHTYWRAHYTDTSWDVIELDGKAIGRLYVSRWPDDIRIVDIAILPEHRSRGIGTALINGIFAEGDSSGRKVSIHVEMFNPARALYERLGFSVAGEHGVYLRLERPPLAPVPAPVMPR
jgi:ribosomal protein S18 acetylase RimI-like enzyme